MERCFVTSNEAYPLTCYLIGKSKTVSAWFEKYPSIEVVSRDRSAEFAAAASAGAPQAVQVADRWHITKNLSEALSALLARCRADKLRASRAEVFTEEALPEAAREDRPYRSRKEEQARLARKAEREQRSAHIMALHNQGFGSASIASQLGMGARTVRDWLAQGSSPEPGRRRRRPSLIDRYEAYVLKRWEEGCRNGAQLYQELLQQGYQGSPRAMYRYLARVRPARSIHRKRLPLQEEVLVGPLERLSVRRTTWLFLRKSADLNEKEQEELTLIRQANPKIETAYQLVQSFLQMVRERTGQQLDMWLKAVEESHLPEFASFASGVQQDKAAVLAGLTLQWSNGPTEGQITRLKLIKRSMYGRAKLDLLKLRVLYRSSTTPERKKRTRKANRPLRTSTAIVPREEKYSLNPQHTTFVISEVA